MRAWYWLGLLGVLACGSSKESECGPDSKCATAPGDAGLQSDAAVPEAVAPVELRGRLFDANAATALEGAMLTLGDASTESDGQGRFAFAVSATESVRQLEIARTDYVPVSRAVPGQAETIELFLKKVDLRLTFRGDAGVKARLPSGAGIDIPAGAVEDNQGMRIDGNVTMELAEIDGSVRTQAAALPGDAQAEAEGEAGLVSLERALSIRILDAAEQELTVDRDAEVVALMPSARPDAPFDTGTYSFDAATGRWVTEGKASKLTRDGVRAYHVDVEHLSWWAVGRFFATTSCIRACVKDADGASVTGAQVWVVGSSKAGVGSFYTDSKGCGASDVIADTDVVLVAQYGSSVSASVKINSADPAASAAKNPEACTDGGTLVLKSGEADQCPAGFSTCGNACVDLATDSAHCGACGEACDALEACAVGACTSRPAQRITVNGKVVDRYGRPWAAVEVQIGTVTQMTDALGAFSFDDVSVPYDLKLVRGDPTVYLGLTRPDPELRLDGIRSANSASLRGVVSGGVGFPLPADHRLSVTFVGPVSINFNAIRDPGESGSWGPNSPRWTDLEPMIDGTLFAIQYNNVTDVVTGLASKDITLVNGATLTSPELDLVLQPVTPHAVEFALALSNGMTFTSYDLSLGTFSKNLSSPPATTFRLDVPDELPDSVPARFIARASLGTSNLTHIRYFGAATRRIDIAMTPPAAPLAPADNATGVARDVSFEFTPQAEAITCVSLSWVENADGTGATVYGDTSSMDLLRLAALGITPMPDDGTMTWSVSGQGPTGDVDELLEPGRPPQPPASFASNAPARTLTFAP